MNKLQALESLKAFLKEEYNLLNIIELCHLEPQRIDSWRYWVDDVGNTISIIKNKQRLFIDAEHKVKITDLFYKSYPKDLILKSKQQLILYSSKDNCIIIFLLGNDNRLRVIQYNSAWEIKQPLSYGISLLQKVVKTLINNKLVIFEKFDKVWLGINREELLLTNSIFETIIDI